MLGFASGKQNSARSVEQTLDKLRARKSAVMMLEQTPRLRQVGPHSSTVAASRTSTARTGHPCFLPDTETLLAIGACMLANGVPAARGLPEICVYVAGAECLAVVVSR